MQINLDIGPRHCEESSYGYYNVDGCERELDVHWYPDGKRFGFTDGITEWGVVLCGHSVFSSAIAK